MAAEEKLCRYLDIPVQHIDDRVLKAMNRKGTSAFIRKEDRRDPRAVPDIALRTSLIVGFPGDEEQFEGLLRLCRRPVSRAWGLYYSPEEGRRRPVCPAVPEAEKVRRQGLIMEPSRPSRTRSTSRAWRGGGGAHRGKDGQNRFPLLRSYTFPAPEIDGITYVKGQNLQPGEFIPCRITGAALYDLYAESG